MLMNAWKEARATHAVLGVVATHILLVVSAWGDVPSLKDAAPLFWGSGMGVGIALTGRGVGILANRVNNGAPKPSGD